eukprot:NODE_5638_length_653_cov_508.390728_g5254_i0.p1 GENE.NODE_5638_length_653_cov_508.390728_g5254_i0~~NODE_5638_length_653_cov_508.390728_g5254_i0.p1  ORF type:complete len:159 (+),score=24.57 NODE_5638_length_653_cov_508.390728_g5254_i0:72-548(+)
MMLGQFIFVAFLLVSASSKPVSIVWTDCSNSSYSGRISTVTYSPENPTTGIPISAVASGTLSKAVSGGSSTVSVIVSGIKVLTLRSKVCGTEKITFPLGLGVIDLKLLDCPQAAGPIQFVMSALIADKAPPASSLVNVIGRDTDNALLFCAYIKVQVG